MTDLSGGRFVVAGGGAIGSCVALRLAQAGARVTLCDPAPLGDNASGVAAGMLAPVLETLFDPASTDHYALLRDARDLWPALLDSIGQEAALDRSGGLLTLGAATPARQARLRDLGVAAEVLTLEQARRLSPGLAAPDGGVFYPDDWRIEPEPMLERLRAAFTGLGGLILRERVMAAAPGKAPLANGEAIHADAIVFAGGFAPEFGPELAVLAPIKGQLLRFAAGAAPCVGPIVRTPGAYVAPAAGGPAIGATMEAGRSDLDIDPAVSERLRRAAVAAFPGLAQAPAAGRAGVRWATPDGLPLVGAGSGGAVLAAGARRNGWLLAPMIAAMVCGVLAGEGPGPWGEAFRPGRFRGR